MQRSMIRVGWLTPMAWVALAAGVASAQQVTQKSDSVSETRSLEAEIEEYPGPTEQAVDESDTRIPEQIQPAPKKPKTRPLPVKAPAAASPASPAFSAGAAAGQASTGIDAREVQRVFGQDTDVIDLTTLDAAQVTRLQTRLHELGHYLGVVDGIAGPQTRAALQAVIADQFALSKRLLQQGRMTTELAGQVGIDTHAVGSGAPKGTSTKPSSTPIATPR